jgi:beta-lactamase regulating signal transducer with metallopeptidase domain
LLAGLKLFLGFVDVRRSGIRYLAALGVLGLAMFCLLGTFFWEWRAFSGMGIAEAGGGAVRQGPVVDVVLAPGRAAGFSLVYWLSKCCPYLSMLWIAGVLFYTGRLVLSGFELRRMRRLSGVADAGTSRLLEELRVRLGVSRAVRLLITDRISEPMTFGFFRAVVVLPLHYVSQVPADQLELILAHEMAHIRRRDYLVNLVQHIFDALLFFNPFFRMISTAVREEREYCCDDWGARIGGDERKMAVALTNLGLAKKGLALGLSVAPARRSFYRRVMRLVEPQERPTLSVRGTVLGVLGAVAVVAVLTQCTRSVVAQDALPAVGERMQEVLADNQAGYKEQVFHYTKAGRDHELFMVKTQDGKQAVTAYVDGGRLNREELDLVEHVLSLRRPMDLVLVRDMHEPKKSEDTGPLSRVRLDSVRIQVQGAMDQYKDDVRLIPMAVEQHELLTKIVVNNEYTAEDRRDLAALLVKRQKAFITVTGK